jgi:hypothetical protein
MNLLKPHPVYACTQTRIAYGSFNADTYNGHSAWLIIMDTDNDGKPIDFTPNDETDLRGGFGWGGINLCCIIQNLRRLWWIILKTYRRKTFHSG